MAQGMQTRNKNADPHQEPGLSNDSS